METPFKAVQFSRDDTITRELLQTMQNNNQWLQENTPRGRFFAAGGEERDSMTVVLCGRVFIPRSKKSATAVKKVRFGGEAFHPRCHPNITTGVVSQASKQIFCVVNGPEGKLLPQPTGFEIKVHAEDASTTGAKKKKNNWKISKGFFVYWQAMGFRPENLYDL